MDIASLQPDRILLTLFVSVLVAFVTAALSIVRLVNDKEGKTTDYRQAWTDSVRRSLAELVANINAISGAIVRNADYVEEINAMLASQRENKIEKLSDGDAALQAHLAAQIAAEREHMRSLRRDLHQSYALTRLHFKPNDLSFARIEQKFDVVVGLLGEIHTAEGDSAKADRLLLKEKIHGAATDITSYAQDILKTEWENVKRGEPAYQSTKKWSIAGGGGALFVLLLFGGATAVSYFRGDIKQSGDSPKNCSTISATASGTLSVLPQLPTTPPPHTSQVVNLYTVAPNSAHSRAQSSTPIAIQQQPCSK